MAQVGTAVASPTPGLIRPEVCQRGEADLCLRPRGPKALAGAGPLYPETTPMLSSATLSRTGRAFGRRFIPFLETLEDRTVPSGTVFPASDLTAHAGVF